MHSLGPVVGKGLLTFGPSPTLETFRVCWEIFIVKGYMILQLFTRGGGLSDCREEVEDACGYG